MRFWVQHACVGGGLACGGACAKTSGAFSAAPVASVALLVLLCLSCLRVFMEGERGQGKKKERGEQRQRGAALFFSFSVHAESWSGVWPDLEGKDSPCEEKKEEEHLLRRLVPLALFSLLFSAFLFFFASFHSHCVVVFFLSFLIPSRQLWQVAFHIVC